MSNQKFKLKPVSAKPIAHHPAIISSAKPKVNSSQKVNPIKSTDPGKSEETSTDDNESEIENNKSEEQRNDDKIPEVYKKQGTDGSYSMCPGVAENTCLCSGIGMGDIILGNAKQRLSYLLDKKNWITTDRLFELRKQAQEATKYHKTFTIRGCFYSIRKGLMQRGWVEKLDAHRRAPVTGLCHVVLEDLTQHLPMRRPGESRRQHLTKCERNIMSRFLEHLPIDFLWSARKEKTDWIDMARNPAMTINRFHKSPFTSKEGLCTVLRDFHWFFEEGKSELYYPRSYNVWSTDDLNEFIENFRMSACISTLRYLLELSKSNGFDEMTSSSGKVPMSCIYFAMNQCKSYVRSSLHYDIDEEQDRPWDYDWDIFLAHHQMLTQENCKLLEDEKLSGSIISIMAVAEKVLDDVSHYWPQYNLDGVYNIWIVKPSNKCRGRGIHLMNDLKKILQLVNPPVVNKGHYVLQKYIGKLKILPTLYVF